MKKHKSQTSSSAGPAAIFLTFFCIIWDGVVFGLMLRQNHIPFWIKSIFVLAGLFVTAAAIYLWWQRLAGGKVRLRLPQDPLPHGVNHVVTFDLNRDITATAWKTHVRIAAKQRNSSSFGTVWEQEFTAQSFGNRQVRSIITLPSDYPSSQSRLDEASYQITLSLQADQLGWDFNLETRPASPDRP